VPEGPAVSSLQAGPDLGLHPCCLMEVRVGGDASVRLDLSDLTGLG
jgi:hypothetical protein